MQLTRNYLHHLLSHSSPHQEFEVQAIEKALARFWREHCSDFTKMPTSQVSLVSPPPPETTPRSEVTEEQQHIEDVPNNKSRDSAEETPEHLKPTPFSIGFEAVVPKLYISVSDQRSNLEYLDMAHRAGLLSNLAHKLITNIITRCNGEGAVQAVEYKLFIFYLKDPAGPPQRASKNIHKNIIKIYNKF